MSDDRSRHRAPLTVRDNNERCQPDFRLSRMQSTSTSELAALNRMLIVSASYFLLTQNRLPTANEGQELVSSVPPGAKREDKFLWAAWQLESLVGCIEITRHWPARDLAYIGYLQVHDAKRRRGIGTQTLELACHRVRGWSGVRRLQLAVSENNASGLAFWLAVGFRVTGHREHRSGFTAPLIVMERPLR